jgi:hypothetical protein
VSIEIRKVSPIKQALIDKAKANLTELGANFFCPDGVGVHIIIQFNNGRIDFWPTTCRWKRDGSMNEGTKNLWRLLGYDNYGL